MAATGTRGARRWVTGLTHSVRAYRWGRRELRRIQNVLRTDGIQARAEAAIGIAPRGPRGLRLAMRSLSPTCLERALLLQAWHAAFSAPPDVIIGVRRTQSAFEAHAWVEGEDRWQEPGYAELTRLSWGAGDAW